VSMDDARNAWHDFTTDEDGGVLDLVGRIRGSDRQDALRWLAEFAGVRLDHRPLTAEDRSRWVRQQREVKPDLPVARLWRRAAIVLSEDLLEFLKAALFDPAPRAQIDASEIRDIAQFRRRLRHLDGPELVGEYAEWMGRFPQLTAGIVHAARLRETAERRALQAYPALIASEAPAP